MIKGNCTTWCGASQDVAWLSARCQRWFLPRVKRLRVDQQAFQSDKEALRLRVAVAVALFQSATGGLRGVNTFVRGAGQLACPRFGTVR